MSVPFRAFLNGKGMCYNVCPLDLSAFDGAWCNGSTPDFESVDLGSNPGAPAYFLSDL